MKAVVTESLRDRLLDVIASALPETPEIQAFIDDISDDGGFLTMLDRVMDTIVNFIKEDNQ